MSEAVVARRGSHAIELNAGPISIWGAWDRSAERLFSYRAHEGTSLAHSPL